MTQPWRTELKVWADGCSRRTAKRKGILGVVMGGSLARGQEWRHSDLELGVLVEERDSGLPYFNVDAGRGVEIIQLVRPELEEQIKRVEGGDLAPVLRWPIQLWQCRVVRDPTGILARFKQQFDAGLFAPEVVEQRIAGLRLAITKALDEARELLAANRPAAALVRTRLAMNDAILALHWAHGQLPRSQNRTDSRLRLLCRKHGEGAFYALYREVFGLAETAHAIKRAWPMVKANVLEITRLWGGDPARDFFRYAVDGDFQWRQNAGILTVYRLYIPIIGAPEQGIYSKLDDPEWAAHNRDLLVFLGLADAGLDSVSALVERVADACRVFLSPSRPPR